MPELPEVETVRRGIAPALVGNSVSAVVVRQRRLRWPVPASLQRDLPGHTIRSVERRAKFLLVGTRSGTLLMHLGMSGRLRVVGDEPPGKHDHVDIELDRGQRLRFTDPRRFGSMLWTRRDPLRHRLLRDLGPEPLGEHFDGDYLYDSARGRRVAIKQHLMNGAVVAGIGNIYASEALALAGINPRRAAGRISRQRMEALAGAVRTVLEDAIAAGGTTLRDYVGSDGEPGYFKVALAVYDRAGEPCKRCGTAIRRIVQGQRATYYCPRCQT